MTAITVTEPNGQGFTCKEALIAVYTLDGKPFYVKSNPLSNDGKNIEAMHFNLPFGSYKTMNVLRPATFRKYKLPYLHTPEKKNIELIAPNVTYGDNPNKASVNVVNGDIFVDQKFYDSLGIAERTHFFYHEAGHNFYKTEQYCDDFATYQMLRRGFNPSQCHFSGAHCLSNSDKPYKNSMSPLDRRKRIFNNSKNAF